MQGTRICIIGILTIFIITTYSFSQVTMEIKNVNTTAGTLDIYMKNSAGCSYCTDPTYSNETDCLVKGSDPNSAADDAVKDATWAFTSDSQNAATCAGVCSNTGIPTGHGICSNTSGTIHYDDFTDQTTCEAAGKTWTASDASKYLSKSSCEELSNFGVNGICSDAYKLRENQCGVCSDTNPLLDDKDACLAESGATWSTEGYTWIDNVWTKSAINGVWFTGAIGGFQFLPTNINVTDADDGLADDNNFYVISKGTDGAVGSCSDALYTTKATCEDAGKTWTGKSFILAFFQTIYIQAGEGILTKVTFDPVNSSVTEICFSDVIDCDVGGNNKSMMSDDNGECVSASWTCACLTTGEEDLGCGCGEAAPSGCDSVCGSSAVLDCFGECGGTAVVDCASVCGGLGVVNTGGDGECCATGVIDCADVCDGSANLTDCGCNETVSDTTTDCCADGLGTNDEAPDCAGICGGSTVDTDSDGVCDVDDDCADTAAAADVDADGCSTDQLSISKMGGAVPYTFAISQNFPNPFNPVTSITFDVAAMDEISLIVYDLAGKEVATLASGTYAPGRYMVEWNAINNTGDGIVSGMYIYRYISNEKAIIRKMLYLK